MISGNTGDGVSITGSGTTANKVTGNFVGTTAAGTAAVANTGSGVRISAGATNNTVGGTTAGARNVLSGNAQYGVQLADGGTTGNVVAGNYVGTDATGTARLANTTGVRLEPGADGTTIGGTAAGAGNLIAGNTGTGVSIGSQGNVVQGNRIGLTTAGLPLGNATGVAITTANNTVGGAAAGARNVISGNSGDGVELTGPGATGNVVAGNYIGTDAAGTAAVGNRFGVYLSAATGNTVGGTAAAARNVISGNTGGGDFYYAGEWRLRPGPTRTWWPATTSASTRPGRRPSPTAATGSSSATPATT